MSEVEVEIPEVGRFVMTKPKAGPRNDAMEKSGGLETESQKMTFLFAVIPHCIKSHPWGNKYENLTAAVRDMETDHYDLLLKAAAQMFKPKGDLRGKSDRSSEGDASETLTPSSPTSTSTNGSGSSEQESHGKNSIATPMTSS